MIRKRGNRFSLAANAERVCEEIMLKQRDEIVMCFRKSHHDLIAKLLSRRHPQRFPQSPFGARFRIRDRATVGRDAAQPADLEDTVGWKVANPWLQDELRRIGEFGAHGLRIAGHAVHLEQHLLETPTLPPTGLP